MRDVKPLAQKTKSTGHQPQLLHRKAHHPGRDHDSIDIDARVQIRRITVKPGVAHRLHNPGKTPLEPIDVQSGSNLGKGNIVRLENVFGRA